MFKIIQPPKVKFGAESFILYNLQKTQPVSA